MLLTQIYHKKLHMCNIYLFVLLVVFHMKRHLSETYLSISRQMIDFHQLD